MPDLWQLFNLSYVLDTFGELVIFTEHPSVQVCLASSLKEIEIICLGHKTLRGGPSFLSRSCQGVPWCYYVSLLVTSRLWWLPYHVMVSFLFVGNFPVSCGKTLGQHTSILLFLDTYIIVHSRWQQQTTKLRMFCYVVTDNSSPLDRWYCHF